MVLVLASALDVPLRERNRLLLAAGYAPVYREKSFGAPEMKELQKTIDLVLRTHDPFPAVVVDRRWEVLASNASAQRMLAKLVNPMEVGPLMTNAFHLTFHPKGLRRVLMNWDEVAAILVQRLRREALDDPGPDGPAGLLDALTQYGPLPAGDNALAGEPKLLIPLRI